MNPDLAAHYLDGIDDAGRSSLSPQEARAAARRAKSMGRGSDALRAYWLGYARGAGAEGAIGKNALAGADQ